jgi:hypothetical protein
MLLQLPLYFSSDTAHDHSIYKFGNKAIGEVLNFLLIPKEHAINDEDYHNNF